MKICFITTGDIRDIATAKRALGMANPLTNIGWEVHILMEDAYENRKRVILECNSMVKVHYFPKSNAWEEVKAKNKLINFIQPDYLYICAFVFRNIVAVNCKYKKLVEHSELQTGISAIKGTRKILANFLELYSIIYSDALLCASKYLETFFVKKSQNLKINLQILYFPYAFSRDLYKPKEHTTIPANYLKYQNKKNYLFLGQVIRNYGIFTMLEAFKKLSKKHKDIRLIILGSGPDYCEAKSYIQDNNLYEFIEMPGFIEEEDITNYFSIADAFISPMNNTIQDWARCPSKLYMYLPYQKPIYTCKIGEPFQVLNEQGYYYDSSSSESLAEIIDENLINMVASKFVNPEVHTWDYRAKEFDEFIKNSNRFIIRKKSIYNTQNICE